MATKSTEEDRGDSRERKKKDTTGEILRQPGTLSGERQVKRRRVLTRRGFRGQGDCFQGKTLKRKRGTSNSAIKGVS